MSDSTELALADDFGADDTVTAESGGDKKSGLMGAVEGFDFIRQIAMIVALAICLAIAIFIIMWAQEPTYRPLQKMPVEDQIETLDYLDQAKIDYKLDGDVIYVRDNEFEQVKLGITRSGISTSPSAGNDILLTDSGFGVSQRMEKERLKLARETKLARTIEELSKVRRAKVLLAIPKENVFARREKLASATVVITLKRGGFLNEEEVDSIVDIVSSSVEGLEPSRVTVSDNHGRLLNSGSQNAASARQRREYELEQQRVTDYKRKIDTILIPVLGLGNYTAEVDVTMDFTKVENTQKRYNPDLPAVRSEMTVETNSTGSVIAGVPGALTNQPPGGSVIPETSPSGRDRDAPSGRNHKEATRNYELDTTISHTQQQTGVVRRLSVSVAVDYKKDQIDEETVNWIPRNQEELLNIRRLLQGGIGFDVQRGDTLEVVTIPFAKDRSLEEHVVPVYEQEWFMQVMRLGMGALVIMVLILAVVRPMLRKLIYPEDAKDLESELDAGLDLGDETIELLSQQFDEGQVGFAADGTLMLPDLHKDEDILKAVRALVANEPELSAQVVKSWLDQDD